MRVIARSQAATALIIGGTQHPLTGPTDQSTAIGLKNLHNCLNASGCVYNTDPAVDPSTSFLLVADPMRPNGGILMRFKRVPTIPLLGITFWGAAPTNSAVLNDNGTPSDPSDDTFVYPTVDVAQRYDGLGGDFPVRPLNLLATVNALAG